MLTQNVDANHGSSATTYASYLVSQIKVRSVPLFPNNSRNTILMLQHLPLDWLVQVFDFVLVVLHQHDGACEQQARRATVDRVGHP